MKNNQPQLHVTSTLIAQESITLNVISMNTGRIHTPWLVLVRGASSAFGRRFGGLNARAAAVAWAVPVSPGSWAPGGEVLLHRATTKKSRPALELVGSTKCCFPAGPAECLRCSLFLQNSASALQRAEGAAGSRVACSLVLTQVEPTSGLNGRWCDGVGGIEAPGLSHD